MGKNKAKNRICFYYGRIKWKMHRYTLDLLNIQKRLKNN